MTTRRWSDMLTRIAESILAVVLVCVFFVAFLGILSYSFPEGANLANLIRNDGYVTDPVEQARFDLGLEERRSRPIAALLSHVLHTVKEKQANSVVWENAESGIPLRERHAVQSFRGSGATIAFDELNQLELGENSLIVVRKMEQDGWTGKRSAAVMLFDGEIFGQFGSGRGEGMQVQVATARSSVEVDSTVGKKAEFKVRVGADQSAAYSVFEGRAVVTAGTRQLTLNANQGLTVDPSGRPGRIITLPSAPQVSSPAPQAVVYYRDVPPRIGFEWEPQADASGYRLTLARDPEFKQIVYQADVEQNALVHGNLPEGDYFWRVAGAIDGSEGRPSDTRSLEVVRDAEAPPLSVGFPEGTVRQDRLLLSGKTEPGSTVFIQAERIEVLDSGEFRHEIALRAGLNVVIVESVDVAGNVTYESRLVDAEF